MLLSLPVLYTLFDHSLAAFDIDDILMLLVLRVNACFRCILLCKMWVTRLHVELPILELRSHARMA